MKLSRRPVEFVGVRRSNWAALAIGLSFAIVATDVRAQPVERNLPPAFNAPQPELATPSPGSTNDNRLLGANLSAIVLLGPTSPVATDVAAGGVNATLVTRLNRPRERRALARFIGRPISRKLISEIETRIVREYRRQGFPFVEVSTPAQEISGGVLQIRVVEFRVGKLTIAHAAAREADGIARQIRTRTGDEIDAPLLLQDLDWLNRYPGRTISPTFSPGATLGETDLSLVVTRSRAWSLYAGYANSGSPASGDDRYFVGASLGSHLLTDALISAQITGSPDFWATDWQPFHDNHPLYKSAAGRLVVATGPRQDIEVTVDAVETNEASSPFVVRQQTLEATLGYRSALSNLLPLPGDVEVGVEASRQWRKTFFGGVEALGLSVDVDQLFGDWSDYWSDRLGQTSVDVSLHGSAGGLDHRNTGVAFATLTNGRVTSAAYAYGSANVTRQTALPLGLRLVTEFNGQYADRPLPDSQQIALGGQTAVRAYTLDDGAWDDAFVLRNDVQASPMSIVRRGALASDLAPLIFVDAGYGRDDGPGHSIWIASAGLGANLRLGHYIVAGLDVAWPFVGAKVTRAYDTHLDARLSIKY
jgi:hemolysin activation/secretion protein